MRPDTPRLGLLVVGGILSWLGYFIWVLTPWTQLRRGVWP